VTHDDAERPQYNHDARKGETRGPDDRDPHAQLNTPVADIEAQADVEGRPARGPVADIEGMGSGQKRNPGQGAGDPSLGTRPDRETRNPAQTTPRGVEDAEAEAMRAAEEATGVPLTDDRR
jgi:hypothetical protein